MNILFPLEYVLSVILNFYIALTGNYGFSLILLSISVSILLYPLYDLAEKWKVDEQNIKEKMNNDIKDIKSTFSGQKSFYLIQTAHRIYGYTALYPLKTSLGIFIQIPLFFAAYNVISVYPNFLGETFLFVTDLGKPDNLFLGLNLLPILMTIINIFSGLLYSHSFKIKDNITTLILALSFFFLLYNRPSSLLLYWTMNNFLSLIKNIFRQKQKSFTLMDKNEKYLLRIILKAYSIYFIIICCILSIVNGYPILTKYSFLILSSILFLYAFKQKKILLLLKHHTAAVILFAVLSGFYIFKLPVNGILRDDLIKVLLITNILYLFIIAAKSSLYIHAYDNRILYPLCYFSAACILFDICISHPIRLYVQCPLDLGEYFSSVLLYSIFLFMILFCIFILFTFILRKQIGSILFYTLLLLVLHITYTYFVQYDAGVLTGFVLSKDIYFDKIQLPAFLLDCFVGFISIGSVIYGLQCKMKFLYTYTPVLFIIQLLVATVTVVTNNELFHQHSMHTNKEASLPQEVFDIHNFSKADKNFIYLCPDMCNSQYIKSLKDDIPNFESIFEGFTYYSNALSVSGWTESSLPALWAGQAFSPKENNKNSISVREAQAIASKMFDDTFEKAGYDVSKISISNYPRHNMNVYAEYYMQQNNISLLKIGKNRILPMLSLLNAVPHVLKPIIYDHGQWLVFDEKLLFAYHREVAIRSIGYQDLLTKISSTSNQKPKALFVRTELTHSPFGILSDGGLVENSYPDENEKSFDTGTAAYHSARCYFEYTIKWMQWLKDNGIYDNTTIAIVSDHGNNCFDNNIPVCDGMDPLHISRSNALVMIKPAFSKGNMRIEETASMSNGNVIGLICDQLKIPHTFVVNTSSQRDYSYMTDLEALRHKVVPQPYAHYTVTGNIFDASAWKKDKNQGSAHAEP